MNFTTLPNMTCTQVGDAWSAVETFDGTSWHPLAPNTARAGQAAVKMWLKGVDISSGNVMAADADVPGYPELKGPASGYRIGLIQIITKLPVMTARYEGYKYKRWLQKTIPFFDSDGVTNSPWYNAGARTDLRAGSNGPVTIRDYPTTAASVRFDSSPGSARLEELHKALDFDVYLAVAPKTRNYKQKGIRILQKLTWTTETRVVITWDGGGALSYTASAFSRAASAVTSVNVGDSDTLVGKMPISAEGANEAISVKDLL